MTSSLPSMAASYASHGWPVFPLHSPSNGPTGCDCRRTCGKNAAKHPRTAHGLLDASTDLAIVTRWWETWPSANIGIATGAVSGLVVLDVDVRANGDASLCTLTDEYGQLPDTATVLTGGGGLHYYFSHPGEIVRNSAGKLGAGLDIRGDGGYVVAPPSVHRSGSLYEWARACEPTPTPGWLLARLRSRLSIDADTPFDTASALAGVTEGERDDTLFRLACKLRRADVPRVMAEEMLLRAAANCSPPLPVPQARAKIDAAYRRYAPAANEPRANRSRFVNLR